MTYDDYYSLNYYCYYHSLEAPKNPKTKAAAPGAPERRRRPRRRDEPGAPWGQSMVNDNWQ